MNAGSKNSGMSDDFYKPGNKTDRALAAVEVLPHDLVYAGFSNGGACAELLAATRPGARQAILIHAPLMVRDLGWTVWPWRLAALD